MKTITLFALAAAALAASLAASAETYHYPQVMNGKTSRVEVRAELGDALSRGAVKAGEQSYVAAPVGQPMTRDDVRAALAAARANHELSSGEFAYQGGSGDRSHGFLAQGGSRRVEQ